MPLIDRRLIRKYDRPGPRYTSYPTAPQLAPEFGPVELDEALARSNEAGRPLSLYLHIPFCRSLCLYCACNVVITSRPERIEEYLGYLEREIGMLASRVDPGRPVVQLHWGGGTPSYLTPDQIRALGAVLAKQFTISDDVEAGVEIDPRRVTREHIQAFREVGFNRVSLGVQDVDPHVQAAVNRLQPLDTIRQVIDWCRELGFGSLNLDLMYGLPHQTVESYESTLDAVLELDADRFAVFNYAHVPWLKRHQAALPSEAMPSPDEKLDIQARVIERLTDGGYVFIGMDHFARPEDELAESQRAGTLWRNFQGYTTRAGVDLLGLGVTALGLFDDAYYQNERELEPYYTRLVEGRPPVARGVELTDEDRLRRAVIMDLMCHFRLDVPAIEHTYDVAFWDHFAAEREALRDLEADGLVALEPQKITVNERGRLLIRNVAMTFDAYLNGAAKTRFSQTV